MMKNTKNRMMQLIVTLCMVMLCFAAAAVTAQADGESPYSSLIPTGSEETSALEAKRVTFNNVKWYIIEDKSTDATKPTVTLLAADNSFGISAYFDGVGHLPKDYSESDIKEKLDK